MIRISCPAWRGRREILYLGQEHEARVLSGPSAGCDRAWGEAGPEPVSPALVNEPWRIR